MKKKYIKFILFIFIAYALGYYRGYRDGGFNAYQRMEKVIIEQLQNLNGN